MECYVKFFVVLLIFMGMNFGGFNEIDLWIDKFFVIMILLI